MQYETYNNTYKALFKKKKIQTKSDQTSNLTKVSRNFCLEQNNTQDRTGIQSAKSRKGILKDKKPVSLTNCKEKERKGERRIID